MRAPPDHQAATILHGDNHFGDSSVETAPRPPLAGTHAGTLVANRYRVMERLGKGGMAAVYRAIDRADGSDYAVKFLDRCHALDPEMARRCQREARTMAELSHPHIPRSFLVGTTDHGDLYIVMEFLRGRDLEQVLRAEGPLPWPRAVSVALQLCDALSEVHANNIVHRDVKPSNCFLDESLGADFVKLIDFGIARDLDASGEQTGTGMILGTAGYVAPELLCGTSRASPRTDIYALGVTIFRLVTGKLPWPGLAAHEIAYQQQTGEPRRLHDFARDTATLPRSADLTLSRALARDPEQRYDSAEAFAAALRATLRDPPIAHEAPPDPGPDPPRPGPPRLSLIRPPEPTPAPHSLLPNLLPPPPELPIQHLPPPGPPSPSLHHARSLLLCGTLALSCLLVLLLPLGRPSERSSVDPPSLRGLPPVAAVTSTPAAPTPATPAIAAPAQQARDFDIPRATAKLQRRSSDLRTTCASAAGDRRSIRLTLSVAPSGRIARVQASPSAFRDCAAQLLRNTTFDPSEHGGDVNLTLAVDAAPPPLM